MRILGLLLVGLAFAAHAQPQEGDAICKGSNVPATWAAVGEMVSPLCNLRTDIYEANAWILGKLNNTTVACKEIDYEDEPAPNIGYVTCGRAYSDTCSPTFDGTPNAYLLMKAQKCVLGAKANPQLVMSEGFLPIDKLQSGFSIYEAAKKEGKRVGQIFLEENYEWALAKNGSTLTLGSIKAKHWPLCIKWNDAAFLHGSLIEAERGDYNGIVTAPIRMYVDPDCPEHNDGLNAFVLERMPQSVYSGAKFNVCALWKGMGYGHYKLDLESYGVHDKACGLAGIGPKSVNSKSFDIPKKAKATATATLPYQPFRREAVYPSFREDGWNF